MNAVTAYLLLLLMCLVLQTKAAKQEKQQFEDRVRDIASGEYNSELANLWGEMENAANSNHIKKKPYQYLLAAPVHWDNESQPSVNSSEVRYYENINVVQAKTDCDLVCQKKLNNIRTKLDSSELLDRLITYETRCNTAVHTELQFLYGEDFRAVLKNGGIFLIYSYYIPCAGLAKCSLGECAGDLAYGLVEMRRENSVNPVYFVIMYSKVFKRQSGSTNECTSKLYHKHAGIPMLICEKSQNTRQCSVSLGEEVINPNYIGNPVFHRFPRITQVSQKKFKKADVFIACLAMGGFLQTMTQSSLIERGKSLTAEQLYQRDANTAKLIASWLSMVSDPNENQEPNIRHIGDALDLIHRNVKVVGEISIVDRCRSYNSCLTDLSDGPPTIEENGTNLSDKVLKDLCGAYSQRLRLGRRKVKVCKNPRPKKRPRIN